MNTQRKVKKVQARHILVADKELAEKIKVEIDEGADFSLKRLKNIANALPKNAGEI